jgi:hypothetical protein
MTPTPLIAETPRPARRAALLFVLSALGLMIATAVCLLIHASVAVILALPLLSLICLSLAIELSPATRYEAVDSATREASSRGLRELELYANRGRRH